MGYRKFKADLLFDGKKMLDNGHILITDDKGVVQCIADEKDASGDIEIFNGLITPGFVNTHCHVELSHLKGLVPKGTGLIEFLVTVIRKRGYPSEVIADAMVTALQEMEASGTIAVADICNTADSLAVKKNSHIHWHNFIEVMGFTPEPEKRFEFALKLLREFQMFHFEWADANVSTFHASVTPHSPYAVSEKLFRLINDSLPKLLTIHNQETAAENELYQHKSGALLSLYEALHIDPSFFQASGKSSIQTYLPLLDHASKILLVHNTYTSEEDIRLLQQMTATNFQKHFFSICINANKYIEETVPPINLLRDHSVRLCLGTDSLASNDSINMLDEMKTIQLHFPNIPLEEMLGWATINGAIALNIDDRTGSFTNGKTPGIVHISNIEKGKLTTASASKRIL